MNDVFFLNKRAIIWEEGLTNAISSFVEINIHVAIVLVGRPFWDSGQCNRYFYSLLLYCHPDNLWLTYAIRSIVSLKGINENPTEIQDHQSWHLQYNRISLQVERRKRLESVQSWVNLVGLRHHLSSFRLHRPLG